jgi:hypothetical protein
MPYESIPQPLRNVLEGVLHANLFSTWRDDLTRWDISHADQSRVLRHQIAVAALTRAIDPAFFQRLTGHWVTDDASTQAWFAKLYTEFYGRAPENADIGLPD